MTPNTTLENTLEDLEGAYFRGNNAVNDELWAQSAASSGHIELTNWGSVGGIFLGLIYGSLVLGVKKDFSKMGRFWSRMPGAKTPSKGSRTQAPSWGTK